MRLTIFLATLSCLLVACGGSGGQDPILGTPSLAIAPIVVLTNPEKLVPIATGVAANMALTAKFSRDMTTSSLNATSFTVACAGSPMTGTVTYDTLSRQAIFEHANFTIGATCEAVITTQAKDTAGTGLAENYVWSFVIGAADVTSPIISANSPANAAIGVCLSKSVSVTFSEPMNSSTITAANFYVTGPNPATTVVPGSIAYDSLSKTATFAVTAPLGFSANSAYTTHVTTGVKDLAGIGLASNNLLIFTTGMQACAPAAPVNLRSVASYGVFGGGAGATNSGITTVVNGDLGTTGVCTTITGFHDAQNTYTEGANLGSVRGSIYCAPPAPGTLLSEAIATQAAADALVAYTELAAITNAALAGTGTGELGGLTLRPGTYTPTPASFELKTGNLTLDAAGDADAIWVFQVPTTITIGETAQARSVLLINGAQAKNVFWQVGSSARIENGSTMVGTIIAHSSITFSTVGQTVQTTLTGRAIALNASVTMVNTTVTVP